VGSQRERAKKSGERVGKSSENKSSGTKGKEKGTPLGERKGEQDEKRGCHRHWQGGQQIHSKGTARAVKGGVTTGNKTGEQGYVE